MNLLLEPYMQVLHRPLRLFRAPLRRQKMRLKKKTNNIVVYFVLIPVIAAQISCQKEKGYTVVDYRRDTADKLQRISEHESAAISAKCNQAAKKLRAGDKSSCPYLISAKITQGRSG